MSSKIKTPIFMGDFIMVLIYCTFNFAAVLYVGTRLIMKLLLLAQVLESPVEGIIFHDCPFTVPVPPVTELTLI